MRKFFIKLSSGDQFEISELDFNNIKGRVSSGRSNGWYHQRGESIGAKHDWSIQFKDVASFWSDSDKRVKVKKIRDIDVEKRLPPEVGANDPEPEPKCQHDWNNPETYEFKSQTVSGIDRYYKVCRKCGAKSTIVKKREVELAMQKENKTLDDIMSI